MAVKKSKNKKGKKVVVKHVKAKPKSSTSTKKEAKIYAHKVIDSFTPQKKTKRLFGTNNTTTHRSMQTLVEQTTRSFWMFVGSLLLLVGTLLWSFHIRNNVPQSILFTGDADMKETITGIQDTDIGEALDTQIVSKNTIYRDSIQQNIRNLYHDINKNTMSSLSGYFDSYMQKSSLVKQYFTPQRLSLLNTYIVGGINVVSVEELPLLRSERVRAAYTLEYTLRDGQKFTETREVTMRPQDDDRKIGTIGCVSKGCSVHPFFNFAKYAIK